MRRIENYPDANDKKGISPWFRVSLVGTYHRGIQVGLRWTDLTMHSDGENYRRTNYKAGEKGDIKALLIGLIPFEDIENIDWEGDEYYDYPHIYCYFSHLLFFTSRRALRGSGILCRDHPAARNSSLYGGGDIQERAKIQQKAWPSRLAIIPEKALSGIPHRLFFFADSRPRQKATAQSNNPRDHSFYFTTSTGHLASCMMRSARLPISRS